MSEAENTPDEKTIPFFPDHIRTEAKVALGLLILVVAIGVFGMLRPIGLEPPADPMDTPAHAKPEWYFLFLYQMLKYVPKTLGVIIPIVGLIVIALWPFFDRKEDTLKARRVRWAIVIVAGVVITALTLLGAFS
ncbi:MAG: cytochrome b subunit of the bc complex [Anaerolineales bacterium]|jgi:cytochrome b6-f complex subunit 4